jgi:TetR/AcrR family transcriptional regulator
MAGAVSAAESGDAEERILAGALEAFSEHGFDGAKMRDIAARAGVTLGLLQYYFGSKQKLWRAAVDRAFEDMRGGLQALLANDSGADPRERLRQIVRAHVSFVAQRPEFVRLMHDEGKRRGPRMRWLVDRHVKPLYALFMPVVERAQQAGVLPLGIPPMHFVYIFIGATSVIFHQAEECKRVTGVDPASPAAVAAHTRAVEHFLLGSASVEASR